MEDVEDFFDFSKSYERIKVPSGTQSKKPNENVDCKPIVKREKVGNDYARECIKKGQDQLFKIEPSTSTSRKRGLNEGNENDCVRAKIPRNDNDLYMKYNFEFHEEIELPINENRKNILEAIHSSPVVIFQGDTGCGKTTQIPQFILEDAHSRNEYCNIVCTQPRRIAAISIAERVCSERKWKIGDVVGYQVGLNQKISEDTRLVYCTTGFLLEKLTANKDMSCYTHVILDEIHERTEEIDFLMIIIRRLLSTNSKNVKLILMSATINSKEFAEYFQYSSDGILMPAPVVKVDSRRLYSVTEYYLDELDRIIFDKNNLINYEEPGISDSMYKLCLKLIVVCRGLASVEMEQEDDGDDVIQPSILIFLPGVHEIDRMHKECEKLNEIAQDGGAKIIPIRLHSMISTEEQKLAFRKVDKNFIKVILATNIAESSITVPDVKYVIDFCLTKYLLTDSSTNLTTLRLDWASRANCKQRSGRAGRVMNGRVYRLVFKEFYNNTMQEQIVPEILRCSLSKLVLKAKLFDMGSPETILGLAIDPPNLSDIKNTILVLKEVGALYQTVDGQYKDLDGDLTYIGRVMASLPIDIHFSRLILFGYIFNVFEETIIIAAGLSVKNIFKRPSKELMRSWSQKLTWSDETGSDLIAIQRAYSVWSKLTIQKSFDDEYTESSWANRYFINLKCIKEMNILVKELKDRLKYVGLVKTTDNQWLEAEKVIILKTVIAGAFYPNYFLKITTDNPVIECETFRVLGGRDPCNTVYFSGFDKKFIGQLYVNQIKDIFKKADIHSNNIEVRFESGSTKIYVYFKDSSECQSFVVPGQIRKEVYKAIKMRQLRFKTTIKVMDPQDAIQFATKKKLGAMEQGEWVPKKRQMINPELIILPSLFTKRVRGKVTHIEHCGKFWFQPFSEEMRLKEFKNELNGPSSDISPFNDASEIFIGMMVAAPYSLDHVFYRAKILSPVHSQETNISFHVLFIDYGYSKIIELDKLRKLGRASIRLNDIPPRCFECYLSGIQPSSMKCYNEKWSEEAITEMEEFVSQGIMELEVYSVVNGITSAILKYGDKVFNDILMKKGYARHLEENYMSKHDHDNRLRQQKIDGITKTDRMSQKEYILSSIDNDLFTEEAPIQCCKNKIELRGPFSPLETRINAVTRIGQMKSVIVEQDSVNSVLLDNEPQKLMVAACVSESQSNKLIARDTTLMPNIPGFGALVTMIFCPQMQIRRNKQKTKYVSLLAGLGELNSQAIFEEHDVVLNLDVEIDSNDLENINEIRYTMDKLLHTDENNKMPGMVKFKSHGLKEKLKVLIIKLFTKRRKYMETHDYIHNHIWRKLQEDNDDILKPENIYLNRAIFPLHYGFRLYDEDSYSCQELRDHCRTLYELAEKHKFESCKLCSKRLETAIELRIHLLSQLHLDREYQIGFHQ